MILILLGPPGSGKGTQAKRLSSERKWPHLSTGDMLRSAISAGSKTGLEAKSYIDQGTLVPDSVVINLIAERMSAPDCKNGFILDGFPRNISQAEALQKMLTSQKLDIDHVVLFVISDQALIERLSGRRTCSSCSTMYHLQGAPSKTPGICDQCGSPLIQRSDDQTDVVRKRLSVYAKETEPLIAYYRDKGKLSQIDATQPPANVSEQLSRVLK